MTDIDAKGELLPCPFCGSSNVAIIGRTCDRNTPYDPADFAYPRAICKCGVEVPGKDWGKPETAAAAWNRRAAQEPQAVAVKPPEWRHDYDRTISALTVLGTYMISEYVGMTKPFKLGGPLLKFSYHDTLEDAKDWAYRNLQRRILSALASPPPSGVAVTEAQPIDTAPAVDHMHCILVFWRSTGKWHECYWDVDEEFHERLASWPSPEAGWRSQGDACIPRNQEDALFWMPMPCVPTAALAHNGEG